MKAKLIHQRLDPKEDLYKKIQLIVQKNRIKAGVIVSGVGSLTVASIRLASAKKPQVFKGPFEIVSLIGTVSKSGLHIHISIADKKGKVIGGHLKEGSLVYTTVELSILSDSSCEFLREIDSKTGYLELKIKK